jgi:hypothetical protein
MAASLGNAIQVEGQGQMEGIPWSSGLGGVRHEVNSFLYENYFGLRAPTSSRVICILLFMFTLSFQLLVAH